jgi:hypothetical protein
MASRVVDPNLDNFQIRRYGPNETVPIRAIESSMVVADPPARQGDFILTHSSGVFGRLIRFPYVYGIGEKTGFLLTGAMLQFL